MGEVIELDAQLITIEARLYDALCDVIARPEFGDMRVWATTGVLATPQHNIITATNRD